MKKYKITSLNYNKLILIDRNFPRINPNELFFFCFWFNGSVFFNNILSPEYTNQSSERDLLWFHLIQQFHGINFFFFVFFFGIFYSNGGWNLLVVCCFFMVCLVNGKIFWFCFFHWLLNVFFSGGDYTNNIKYLKIILFLLRVC